MANPDFHNSTRKDLANSGLVYDEAMGSSAQAELSNNLEGTESARGLLQPNQNFERGLGSANPQDDGMSQAIQNKYMGKFNQEQDAFKNVQKLDAQKQSFDKVSQASQLVNQEMAMNFEKALEKEKRRRASKAARAGIVGNVLGIVVGAVAGYFTGGAGAAAGYAAGNAAGSAIAGG